MMKKYRIIPKGNHTEDIIIQLSKRMYGILQRRHKKTEIHVNPNRREKYFELCTPTTDVPDIEDALKIIYKRLYVGGHGTTKKWNGDYTIEDDGYVSEPEWQKVTDIDEYENDIPKRDEREINKLLERNVFLENKLRKLQDKTIDNDSYKYDDGMKLLQTAMKNKTRIDHAAILDLSLYSGLIEGLDSRISRLMKKQGPEAVMILEENGGRRRKEFVLSKINEDELVSTMSFRAASEAKRLSQTVPENETNEEEMEFIDSTIETYKRQLNANKEFNVLESYMNEIGASNKIKFPQIVVLEETKKNSILSVHSPISLTYIPDDKMSGIASWHVDRAIQESIEDNVEIRNGIAKKSIKLQKNGAGKILEKIERKLLDLNQKHLTPFNLESKLNVFRI